jgi:hypothetical protein
VIGVTVRPYLVRQRVGFADTLHANETGGSYRLDETPA